MDSVVGVLRIHVKRGINLVVRDAVTNSSDPYVVIRIGDRKIRTRTIKRNCNPVWDDELTLSIDDTTVPILLIVYDKDTLTSDDRMGDAEFMLQPLLDCHKMGLANLPTPTTIAKIPAKSTNCLADESLVIWKDGKILQDMILRLRNVQSGEVQIQIEWTKIEH